MEIFGKTRIHTVVVEGELKNGNTGRTKHWSQANRERQMWRRVAWKTDGVRKIPRFIEGDFKCGIVVRRVLGKGQRFWDPDSLLRGNAKELIDTMVEKGVVPDDSSKYIEWVLAVQDDSRRELGPFVELDFFI